jgi:hypothetical protein
MCSHTVQTIDTFGVYDFGRSAIIWQNGRQVCQTCGQSKVTSFVAGHDRKGNPIQYVVNQDGTWTNLANEVVHPEEFVQAHFGEYLWKW